MKYLSLDLETTCLEPSPDHILQISMIVEDTSRPDIPVQDLPHFTCFIRPDIIRGSAYALGMNGWILDIISGRNKKYDPTSQYPIYSSKVHFTNGEKAEYTWVHLMMDFLYDHFGSERITVAGKNVAGFDIQFLPPCVKARLKHKVLDPGILFFNPDKDKEVPNLEECKKRAGMDTNVAHDAREDAMDVILILRKAKEMNLFYNG
jgi:DNA polymerase III epsilon subunit-like protein